MLINWYLQLTISLATQQIAIVENPEKNIESGQQFETNKQSAINALKQSKQIKQVQFTTLYYSHIVQKQVPQFYTHTLCTNLDSFNSSLLQNLNLNILLFNASSASFIKK